MLDICDYHANVDAYGLGRGVYPKAAAPQPPFHPHCLCLLSPRIDLINPKPKRNPKAERAFLAGLPATEAAKIAGSREKLQRVLSGKETLEDVYNQGKDELYKWKRVGDVVPEETTPKRQRKPRAAKPKPDKPLELVTVEDYQRAGRLITDTLPDGSTDPQACFDELLKLLDKEVGISTPCQVKSKGKGADLVRQASQRYPDSWIKAADKLGPLYVKTMATRAFCWSYLEPPPRGGQWKLPGFGTLPVEYGAGYLMTQKGDIAVTVHEYAHRLQAALPELDKLFQDLHKSRTDGDPIKSLKSLQPNYGYRRDEVAREDKYIHPYQGKEYGRGAGALEMMSIAFQCVLGLPTARKLVKMDEALTDFGKFYKEDRAMFDFTVGLLFHWRPKP